MCRIDIKLTSTSSIHVCVFTYPSLLTPILSIQPPIIHGSSMDPFIYSRICLLIYPHVHPFISQSIYLFIIHPSIYQPIPLPVHSSIRHPSIRSSVISSNLKNWNSGGRMKREDKGGGRLCTVNSHSAHQARVLAI